jgi:hypothetical protein
VIANKLVKITIRVMVQRLLGGESYSRLYSTLPRIVTPTL